MINRQANKPVNQLTNQPVNQSTSQPITNQLNINEETTFNCQPE